MSPRECIQKKHLWRKEVVSSTVNWLLIKIRRSRENPKKNPDYEREFVYGGFMEQRGIAL